MLRHRVHLMAILMPVHMLHMSPHALHMYWTSLRQTNICSDEFALLSLLFLLLSQQLQLRWSLLHLYLHLHVLLVLICAWQQ
jgi:hypothetical protein